jgi:ubiquinone/menaquinone biosynthesis C-methylase UbiE
MIVDMRSACGGRIGHLRPGLLAVALSIAVLCAVWAPPAPAQNRSESPRDRKEQPQKVLEVTGVKPGMVVGEVGAGDGYFTFPLARAVGPKGRVYANDIKRYGLGIIDERAARERIKNIETVLGAVDDPGFPRHALDMVFMVNSFHEFTEPVEMLANLRRSLKPDATVVIMDRDPKRSGNKSEHLYTEAEIAETAGRAGFDLVRTETFLPVHNLYILKART